MKNSKWGLFISLIVSVCFILVGVKVFIQGNYLFAIVWILISGTSFVNCIKGLFNHNSYSNIDQTFVNHEMEDVYGHRTQASYAKQRLMELEDLYRSGLLTKEEYDTKRKDIIDTL